MVALVLCVGKGTEVKLTFCLCNTLLLSMGSMKHQGLSPVGSANAGLEHDHHQDTTAEVLEALKCDKFVVHKYPISYPARVPCMSNEHEHEVGACTRLIPAL